MLQTYEVCSPKTLFVCFVQARERKDQIKTDLHVYSVYQV